MMIVLPPGESEQIGQMNLTGLEQQILRMKQESAVQYRYDSIADLKFELTARGKIVEAARALYDSGVGFATFENSRCNQDYWVRLSNGGFQQRSDVTPAEAIRDIFHNGRKYAFECATAMVIVLYQGVMDMIGDQAFNTYFANLVLYDWKYDSDLRINSVSGAEVFPGDVVYFKNPDFDPSMPQWQGENTIVMPDGRYYGHGIGNVTADYIIRSLNSRRKPGSTTSAYLMDDVESLDFAYTQRLSNGVARIGSSVYLLA